MVVETIRGMVVMAEGLVKVILLLFNNNGCIHGSISLADMVQVMMMEVMKQ